MQDEVLSYRDNSNVWILVLFWAKPVANCKHWRLEINSTSAIIQQTPAQMVKVKVNVEI